MSLSNLIEPEKLQDIKFNFQYKNPGKKYTNEQIYKLYSSLFSEGNRSTGVLHPSEVANPYNKRCNRRMYLDLANTPVDALFVPENFLNNQLQRIFDLGTLLHLYIQIKLYELGYLESFETPVKDKKIRTQGHADGVFKEGVLELPKGEKAILEIKSINDRGYHNLKGSPKPEHRNQASIYADLLGIKYIYFIYYNKNTSEVKSFLVLVNSVFIAEYRKIAKELVLLLNKNELKKGDNIEEHVLPNRICSSRNDKEATGCKYVDICFKLK